MRTAWLCIGLMLSLAACAALPVPGTATPTPRPTKVVKAKRTRTPVAPPAPEATQTLEFLQFASPTASVSATPQRSVPPTPTNPASSSGPTVPVAEVSPSPAPTQQGQFECKLIWQSPSFQASFSPAEKFTAGWNVKNIGTQSWEAGSVEFTYLGGAKLHNDPSFPLDATVAPGAEIILSVPMKAPKNSTKYTTYWGLRQGDTFFCRLMVQIYVNKR